MAGDTIEFADEKIRIQLSPTRGKENHEVTETDT